MAELTGVYFDTSVLVAGIIDFGKRADPAQQLMAAVADGRLPRPHTAWHCCLEFYSVATRLPVEYRISPDTAVFLVNEEIRARFEVHQLDPAAYGRFLEEAAAERLAGGRVYDAHIAAIARQSEVALVVTDNRRHFTSLLRDRIRVLTSSELLAELVEKA